MFKLPLSESGFSTKKYHLLSDLAMLSLIFVALEQDGGFLELQLIR